MALKKFPAAFMRSKTGVCREEEFYLGIEDKNDFLHYYNNDCNGCTDQCKDHGMMKCTDKQIKFFNSVMDGKLSFVKHSLNIGSIRNDHYTMRAAIILACRFGQSQVLDILIDKVNANFFLVENLNFVVTIVAGVSEARRLEVEKEPSGILDVLIKYDRESISDMHLKHTWVKRRGKFEFTCILRGKYDTTPFMELCGRKNKCMAVVIRKILDSGLVDVNQMVGSSGGKGSALSHAIATGEEQVLRMILDEMIWEKDCPLGRSNQEELQFNLVSCMYQLSNPVEHKCGHACWGCDQLPFPLREDRMDIVQLLMDKCLRVTPENKIGYENEHIKHEYQKLLSNLVHDHLGAMMVSVVEEERRIAHANGKITCYDLETVKGPKGTPRYNFHGDQFERYLRTINEGSSFVDDEHFEELLKDFQTRKCWSCGHREPELLKCTQCGQARYCDALCQEEDWQKHQHWCQQHKNMIKKKRSGKTREERALRKAFQELCLGVESGDY